MPPRRRPHRFPPPVRAARARSAVVTAVLLVGACGSSGGGPAPTAGPATTAPPPERAASRTVDTAPGFLRPVAVDPRPVRLRIAGIGVDVDVVPVGVDGAGDLQVPSPEVAGWYEFGPRPGQPGSSVLAAHVDYEGRPGAFFRLGDVAPGDRVEVVDSEGAVLALTVTEVARVPKAALATSGAFDRAGPARVALVTCGGEFDPARRSYEDNVVVEAEPVG